MIAVYIHILLLWIIDRYTNLQCIHEQLTSPKVTKIAELLETMESSYYPAFKNILQLVTEGKVKLSFFLIIQNCKAHFYSLCFLAAQTLPLTYIVFVL